MKIAIVGSRTWKDEYAIADYIELLADDPGVDVIVSGGAVGVDSFAETWAKYYELKTEIYLPEWDKYGKQAGIIRNQLIVDNSEKVVAFWDGKSKGTLNTIERALKAPNIKQIIISKEQDDAKK